MSPPDRLEGQVLEAIRRYRPQVVLTFGPAGITRHPDHLAIHRATVAAFHRALADGLGVRELYFDAVAADMAGEMGIVDEPDGAPNTFIDVAATASVKLEALRAHARPYQGRRGYGGPAGGPATDDLAALPRLPGGAARAARIRVPAGSAAPLPGKLDPPDLEHSWTP